MWKRLRLWLGLASEREVITDYWHKYYSDAHCTLCGNSGLIDTRKVRTNAGVPVGRINYCICPNGQLYRANNVERKVDHVLP